MNLQHFIPSLVCLQLIVASVEARPAKVPIGSQPEKIIFKDIRYLPRSLDDFGHPKVMVLAFTTTECPLSRRYLPRLQELSAQYRDQGVQFISINVGPDDSLKDVAYQAIEQKADFPFVKDFDGQCARALGASRTPEVVVLDSDRRIRYRGRVDNQYRLGGVKPSADREDLKEAINDILADRKVAVQETTVDGCAISFAEVKHTKSSLTYAKDVAPVIIQHCVECHRPGTEAPFALTTYEKVAAKAGTIAEVVEEQRMPPWFAHPAFGKFINQRALTQKEREILIQWARGGKASGDLAKAPKLPEFSNPKWLIGEPDLVITAGQTRKIAGDRLHTLPVCHPTLRLST